MGVLKKAIFVKVYVVGLYLEKRTTDEPAAISIDEAKRIVIGMRRNVSRQAFVQAVETAIMLNSCSAMPTLRARLDLLEHALPALKKGDVLDFTYLPGSGTRMRCQGQELTIPGKDFADALFSVWLGPKPGRCCSQAPVVRRIPINSDSPTLAYGQRRIRNRDLIWKFSFRTPARGYR
jgi:hypothetical protein